MYECEFDCGFEHTDFDAVGVHEEACLKRGDAAAAAPAEGAADNSGDDDGSGDDDSGGGGGWSSVVRKSAPAAPAAATAAGGGALARSTLSGVAWPADVPYLEEPLWDAKRLGAQAVRDVTRPRMPGVFIKRITDVSHPVCGQKQPFGLFAAKAFRVGDVVGEYCGAVVDKDECAAGGDGYMAALGDGDGSLGCDAGKMGNEARFINDYRGCGLQNCRLSRTVIRTLPTVMVVVVRPIKIGEEILANYGGGFFGADH